MTKEELRQNVVAEARTWIGTRFHNEARLKQVGVDCGQLLLAVYETCGIIPHVETEHYSGDYALHNTDEWYLRLMDSFARRIPGPPRPGDIALWKYGLVYSHGGIVVEWPRIIHAFFCARKVLEFSADLHPLAEWPVLFFDAIGD